jgi:hypothetical protein
MLSVDLTLVHDLNVHKPFSEVVRFHERYAGRELVLQLYAHYLSNSFICGCDTIHIVPW